MPSLGSAFSSKPSQLEKIFYHFEMEKIALLLIYNIFVTKKFFFRNEYQKKFLNCIFLVDPVGWWQTNIFLSLALVIYYLTKIINIKWWWCNIQRFLSYSKNHIWKFMQANSWHHRLFHFYLSFCIQKV